MSAAKDFSGTSSVQTEAIKVRLQGIFKQIDQSIKEGSFDKARTLLADARKLDAENPFISAFAERIVVFEKKTKAGAAPAPAAKPQVSKENFEEYYSFRQKELEEWFKKSQADLLARERAMLARRELKVREEFRLLAEKAGRQPEAASYDPRVIRARETEKSKAQDDLNRRMEEQLAKERDVFASQYSLEHAKLQQEFLDQQHKLLEEQHLDMEEKVRQIRKREAEEFEKRRQEVFRELEAEYQQKLEAVTVAGQVAAEVVPPAPAPEPEQVFLRPAPQDATPEQLKNIRQELREEMERNFMNRIEQMIAAYNKKMDLLGFVMPQSKEEAIELYRKKLKECYAAGQPTVQQAEQLMEFKELLELTFDEHSELETAVRMELYVEEAEKLLRTPGYDPRNPALLHDLKVRYAITADEAIRLEPYFLSSLERMSVRGRILLADDDANIRMSLESVLSANGYTVTLCETVPAAMEVLSKDPADIIISDLKFGPNQPDGFQFFSMVQRDPALRKIPFLLLSAMTDNVYIRTGVQLGVDQYLTKPIDPDFLVAVVEGKLKRFRKV